MTVANKNIRDLINNSGVRKLELAEKLHISTSYFPVFLRKPFTDAQAKAVLIALDKLVNRDAERMNKRHAAIQLELSTYSNDDDNNGDASAEPVAQ